MADEFPTVIDLNVGGERMTTLLSTLTKDKDSMLAAMFSGRHMINKDKDGCFFIDCEGTSFKHILNYLRFGNLPPTEEALKVFELANYFGVQSLATALEKYQSVQGKNRIKEMKRSFDIEQYEALKLEIINMLNRASIDSKENKVLHIHVLTNDASISYQCHERVCAMSYKLNLNYPLQNPSFCRIEVKTRQAISPDMQKCLAHDLCELGFGKYTFLPHYRQIQNNKCCVILLLTNNFLKMCYDFFNQGVY